MLEAWSWSSNSAAEKRLRSFKKYEMLRQYMTVLLIGENPNQHDCEASGVI